jgi:haloalkane dehalogenase
MADAANPGSTNVAQTPEERFVGLSEFPFAPRFVSVGNGLSMHYIDEGPSTGEAVLLLHGQPTWSYLYRRVIPVLTDHGFRAIAPDLIGFGRSDKPTQRTAYTVRAHTEWLLGFVEELALTEVTLVVQDWGGPIGLGALAASPERFARVVAANTVMHTADASLAGSLTWACHGTADGEIVIEPALLDYQRMTQELPRLQPSLFVQGATRLDVSEADCSAYDAPFPDESYCAGARQFPLLMGLTPNSECARQNQHTLQALRSFARPFLTAFSDGDPSTEGWDHVLQRLVPGAANQQHVVIDGAGHFLQEDCGPELGVAIVRFIAENPL